jgi:hypothetical protein
MPPQIKQDLNRSGWETTDFPSVCEKCLPDNPYVQMLKEDHGAVSQILDLAARGQAVMSMEYCTLHGFNVLCAGTLYAI